MRLTLVISLICLIFCGNLISQNTDSEKEIIQFIDDAYQALIDKDLDKYLNTWAHDKTSCRIGISGSNIVELNGWEDIKKSYEKGYKRNPKPLKRDAEFRNFVIKIQDDMAWAAFDKYVQTGDEMIKRTREYRRLVKINGEWKVLLLMHVALPFED